MNSHYFGNSYFVDDIKKGTDEREVETNVRDYFCHAVDAKTRYAVPFLKDISEILGVSVDRKTGLKKAEADEYAN